MCCGDCRPLGFLLGLPFAFLALLVSIVGVIVWIVGYFSFTYIFSLCPCCFCVTVLVELALELIKAPLHVMEWFTSKIPC
ncbi:signaling peptide TAXIMIN 1-like [Silene latifolia]|uniref:signaling peptide TAXIMIN 1-like n=1 Tax=Silene latifolia TaxID=37657 RepID=UPI003D781B61